MAIGIPAESRAGEPARVAGTTRYANVDRLRLVALLDVTYFHVTGAHFSIGLGLPVFLMLTVALNAKATHARSLPRFIGRKAVAYLKPWLAWSVVYAMVFTATAVWHGSEPFRWFEPSMLLLGTQWHLWYMVFGFAASVVTYLADGFARRLDGLLVIVLASLAACLLMFLEGMAGSPSSRAMPWLVSLPSIPIGIALGRCLWESDPRTRVRNTIALFGLVFGGMAVLDVLSSGHSAERYMAAMVPVCGVMLLRGSPDAITTWLTGQRLGVYLIHPLAIHGFTLLLGTPTHGVARAFAVVVCSFVSVWLISKTPLRWMVQMGGLRRDAGNTPSVPFGGADAPGLALPRA